MRALIKRFASSDWRSGKQKAIELGSPPSWRKPEVGVIYHRKVVKVVDFGAFATSSRPLTAWFTFPASRMRRVGTVTERDHEGDASEGQRSIGMDDRGKVQAVMARSSDQETRRSFEDTRPPREPREGGDVKIVPASRAARVRED